jgi:toxin-antitoxin system PIN domain toxin
MKVVDTNILVYAHREEMPFHEGAQAVLKSLSEGAHNWAVAWPSVHEFLAVVTNPRIFNTPTPMQKAWTFLDALGESPSLRLLSETPEHWATLRKMLKESRVVGPRVHDARIAALCLEHGAEVLLTADRDFSRFAGLKVENPLLDVRES